MKTFLKVQRLSTPFRWAVYPVAVCIAAAAVVAAPRPHSDLPSESELAASSQSLAEKQKVIDVRVAYKESLARDLAAGNGSLREVAELFIIANTESPRNLEILRMLNPELSDLACSAKSVITYAEATNLPPSEMARFREQLACEFAQLLTE